MKFMFIPVALLLATPAMAGPAEIQAARQAVMDQKTVHDAQERQAWPATVALDDAHGKYEAELEGKLKWWAECNKACLAWVAEGAKP